MEGIQRSTRKNYSLKIVSSRGGRLRAVRDLDINHAWHLIGALYARVKPNPPREMLFTAGAVPRAGSVEEVYCHPTYLAICLKWGMHEVDASHQLSARIHDAAILLREVLPQSPPPYLRLSAAEVQRVLLRTACLDAYLAGHMWLPERATTPL